MIKSTACSTAKPARIWFVRTYNAIAAFDTLRLRCTCDPFAVPKPPRNFFRQIGFLLYAETSYQRSHRDHYRHLRKYHPRWMPPISANSPIDIHHSV